MPISSLNGILIAANTGLRAAQIQLDLVSRNVTNASVDGYTRKDAPLETLVNGISAQGVNAGEIRRNVSSSLLQEIRAGHSIAETMRVKEDYLARLETLFGAPGDGSSIVAKLGNLANSFRALIGEPDSAALQQQVLLRADDFATSVNALSETIQNLRLDAERTIEAQVTIANGYITQLDQLNTTIAQNRGLSRSTADLDDRRDKLIADLSKIIDIRTFEQSNGQVLVLTKLGRPLLDNDPHQLSFNASSSISPAMSYAGGDLSGILLDGVDISSEIVGGKFRGLLDTRDDNMVSAQAQLDELVSRVAQNFALSDLDLFDYGDVETVVTGRTATATATGGATSFTVSSAAGLSAGMNLRFANHPTTYLVTGVAGTTISLQPATGAGTGIDIDVPSGTAMILAAQPGTASAGFSIRVGVNADVSSAPWRLRDGTSTATIGTISQANAIPRAIVDSFERVQPFTASVGLRTGLTLTAYAGSVIVAQTTARGTLKDTLDARDSLNQQLFTRFSSESGVNVDRELALMIEIQSSYAASAKVIQATRQMFDDLMSVAQ